MFNKTSLLGLALLGLTTSLYATDFDSSYSSIAENDCKLINAANDDDQSSTQRCADFAGISVIVTDFDARQDMILHKIKKDAKRFPLKLSQTVSSAFSALGDKIEWRHKSGQPNDIVGMIVRFNTAEDPDKPDKTTSYLVVSKVLEEQICVVGKVSPQKGKQQNQDAREMADKSATMPCIDQSSLAANTTPDTTPAISRATYKCDGKVAFDVVFEVGKVRYIMLKESVILPEIASVSGSRYSDGETTLWLKDDEAMVEINGVSPLSSCETLSNKT